MTDIGKLLHSLDQRLKAVERSSRLSSASIDNTALEVRDDSGSLRGLVGQQGDGTTAINIVNGPNPPAPTNPTVEPALAALTVTWDGAFADAVAAPLDWMRCEVHIGPTADFAPSQGTLRDTIETPQGGMVTIPLPYTEWHVKLRSRTSSGAVSTPTSAVAGTPRKAETADLTAGIITADLIAVDALTGKTITGGTINGAEFHSDDGDGGLVDIQEGTVSATAASGWSIEIDPSQEHPTITWRDDAASLAGEINGLGDSGRPGLVVSSGPFAEGAVPDWRWATQWGVSLDGSDSWRTARIRESNINAQKGGYIGLSASLAQLAVLDTDDPGNNPILQVEKGIFSFDEGRIIIEPPASSFSALYVTAKSGHTGFLLRLQLNGADRFSVSPAGTVTAAGAVNAASVAATGAVAAATATTTGAITAGGAITGDSLSTAGVLTAANVKAGRVSITPTAANTPTAATVTGLGIPAGVTPRATATASTAVPGTQVTGVGISALTNTSMTIWLTRTNTTSTNIDWIAIGA